MSKENSMFEDFEIKLHQQVVTYNNGWLSNANKETFAKILSVAAYAVKKVGSRFLAEDADQGFRAMTDIINHPSMSDDESTLEFDPVLFKRIQTLAETYTKVEKRLTPELFQSAQHYAELVLG
jgi:hypothetical protein